MVRFRQSYKPAHKRAMRRIGIAAAMMVVPPALWVAILWSDPRASGLPDPVLAYGLALLAMAPGLIGLALLDLRPGVKWLILPFYLIVMAAALLYAMVAFACVLTQDCP